MRRVSIVGGGPGGVEFLTLGAWRRIGEADLVIGSRRMLDVVTMAGGDPRMPSWRQAEPDGGAGACGSMPTGPVTMEEVDAARICDLVGQMPDDSLAVVLMSGDTGMFSGTRRLVDMLATRGDAQVEVLPGISSVAHLAARLGRPWQGWHVASAHGTDCDVVGLTLEHGAGGLFLLTDARSSPDAIAQRLVEAGLGDARVTVGERLSYADENLTCAPAATIAHGSFDALGVMLVELPGESADAAGGSACDVARPGIDGGAWPWLTAGVPDDHFVRGDVPMTKQEVRAVALAKLRLAPGDVLLDVGAGTGSVSVEAARMLAPSGGEVWAVERSEEGCSLIRENARRFGLRNIHVVRGDAPEALEGLCKPDAMFVGGSGGRLDQILAAARQVNPRVRVCVSCITLESLAAATSALTGTGWEDFEVTQVSVARSRTAADLHLMIAQNPVSIVCASGTGPGGASER